jgi:TolB-like protein
MLTRASGEGGELQVKVIDFGLAKAVADGGDEMDLTHGGFIGTPAFASPEQFAGAAADARSDIYSLGVTLWYAVTGEVPYPGRTIDEIRRSQSDLPLPIEKLVSRKVPNCVVELMARILSRDPSERPGSAQKLMASLERCRARVRSGRKWRLAPTFAAVVGAVAVAVAAFILVRQSRDKPSDGFLPAAPKSIAVLPFENMSDDKQNAYFADGVQEEVLTTLAKVAGLKVISRTSVLGYAPSAQRDLREIGRALGVAHVLEGSVRRAGGRVRVTAQLVDSRTNTQVWAESYDRELADVFAIQTEIAQQITKELQVTLSRAEKSAIEKPPTQDLAAFDLYTRARTLRFISAFTPTAINSLLQGVELLNEAVVRDPAFLVAWCELATAHDLIYFSGTDHTPARLTLAENAVNTALRLRPDSGEAHLAFAQHLYWGYLDYERARAELEIARRTLPNDPQIYSLTAYMDRRQGRWGESTRNLERSLELDPRNAFTLRQMAFTYRYLRRH